MRRKSGAGSANSNFIAQWWRSHGPAIFGVIGLGIASLDSQREPSNDPVAYALSRWIYGAFLVASLVVLWWASRENSEQSDKGESASANAPFVWWWADIMLCTYAIVPLLQFVIPSPRPPGSPIEELFGLPIGGWPSGHQVSLFALSWALMAARSRLAWGAFALAVLIGWARLESSAHYPFQVWSGGVLGLALGWWTSRHVKGLLLPRVAGWLGLWKAPAGSAAKGTDAS